MDTHVEKGSHPGPVRLQAVTAAERRSDGLTSRRRPRRAAPDTEKAMPKSGRSTGLNRGNDELRFQTVSAAVVDALVLADLEGNIISWNSAAESIFGYAKAEVLGHPVMTPIPERYWTAHQEGLARLPGGGQSALLGRSTEMVAVKRNGVEIPVEISIGARGGAEAILLRDHP